MKRTIEVNHNELALETAKKNQLPNICKGLILRANDLDGANSTAVAFVDTYPEAKPKHLVDISCNCHGMTFANRRTVIDKPSAVKKILDEDSYQEINVEDCCPGDIIIYYLDGLIDHSGVIVNSTQAKLNPLVLSKWGEIGPEMIHNAQDSPYGVTFKIFRKAPLC